jgi:hypothetical protein
MKAYQKIDLVMNTAIKLDQHITWSPHLGPNTIQLHRIVEGEPGEDPQVDEEIASISPAFVIVTEIQTALEERGVDSGSYKVEIYDSPRPTCLPGSPTQTYPMVLWCIKFEFPIEIKMAPKEIQKKCESLIARNAWRKLYSGKVEKVSKSKLYKVGQEVRPVSRNAPGPSKMEVIHFQWWFLTSARSGGMGKMICYRSDGKVISASRVNPVEAE